MKKFERISDFQKMNEEEMSSSFGGYVPLPTQQVKSHPSNSLTSTVTGSFSNQDTEHRTDTQADVTGVDYPEDN